MRRLKLQVQMTVNGFVGGPNGELDWMTWNWDDSIKNYVNEIHAPVDTIILGRKMTDGFVKHWESVAADPENPDYEFSRKMTDTPKIVFTKTLEKSPWNNTTLAKGDLTDEIKNLKTGHGGDIIVYGGAEFVSNLVNAGLIDDYYLFINPAVIGKGLTIFSGTEKLRRLKLAGSDVFDCGINLLHYIPV
jgi:dihydrofolate reductase